MKIFLNLLPVFCVISMLSCQSPNPVSAPLFAKDTTVPNEKNNTLFVFVGEKLSVEQLQFEPGGLYRAFKAKYKILQRVYGDYPPDLDTIAFEAYDHYGTPPFSTYKNVLLFVSEEDGQWYHEKYMFNDVYRTKDGRWAGSYAWEDYKHEFNLKTTIRPEKIAFVEEVSYPIEGKDEDGTVYSISYPELFFETKGNSAIAVYGNYIEELFKLKRDGYLTARKLFGHQKKDVED